MIVALITLNQQELPIAEYRALCKYNIHNIVPCTIEDMWSGKELEAERTADKQATLDKATEKEKIWVKPLNYQNFMCDLEQLGKAAPNLKYAVESVIVK
jgi:hypothetical protein